MRRTESTKIKHVFTLSTLTDIKHSHHLSVYSTNKTTRPDAVTMSFLCIVRKKQAVCAAGAHHIRVYGTQETDAISFGRYNYRHRTTFAPWGFVDTREVLYFLL